MSDFISDSQFTPDAPSAGSAPGDFISDAHFVSDADKHDTAFGHVASASMGAINSIAPGIGSKALSAIGVPEDFQREVRDANPLSYAAGNVAGMFTGPISKGIGIAGNAAKSAVGGATGVAAKLATEAALFQTTDEIAKYAMKDPQQSLQTAATNVTLSGLLGGSFGMAGGLLGKGVAKVADSKVGEFLQDFRDRLIEHTAPLPEPAMVKNPDYLKFKSGMLDQPMFIKGEQAERSLNMKGLSEGEKAADVFLKSKLAGKGLGATVGGTMGRATGIPFMGTIGAGIGAQSLGPALDAVIKPLINGVVSNEGFEAAAKFLGSIVKGDAAIVNAGRGVFDSAIDVVPGKLVTTREQRDHIKESLAMAQTNPDSIMHSGGSLNPYMPQHNVALGQMTANAVDYLNSIAPKPSGGVNPLDTKIPASKSQQAMFDRALNIANQPLTILQHVKDGTLMAHDMATLNTLYPALHPKLAQSLTNAMIDHRQKGGSIPYRTKVGLSIFMSQPMDASMTSQAIMAAQSTFLPKQQPQSPTKAPSASSTRSLSKMSSQYQTAEQSRAARRNK